MKIIYILFISFIYLTAFADQYVHGYTRNNGQYVQPYYRTEPNGTIADNYSTQGNVNPYTGKPGYLNPNEGYPK